MNEYLTRLSSMPRPTNVEASHNAVSLFSGGGGFDLGLTWAGFSMSYSTDIEPRLCATLKHNFPGGNVVAADIRGLTGRQIIESVGTERIDLLAGGPPCQSFSMNGKRGGSLDQRGQLIYEYVRVIRELRPRAFVLENVVGLLSVEQGALWQILLQELTATGYKIYHQTLNAADYGVPQNRRRVFIVGFLDRSISFKFPDPSHATPVSSRYALESVDGLANHRIRPHSAIVQRRYATLGLGETDRVSRLKRLDPNVASDTVLVGATYGYDSGGAKTFIHPYEPRNLTVRESARLQSFPDWYEFVGVDTWSFICVGNAVPPLLAMAVGQSVKESLSNA